MRRRGLYEDSGGRAALPRARSAGPPASGLQKTAPIPVRDPHGRHRRGGQRSLRTSSARPLHPLDQYRAFQVLRDKGLSPRRRSRLTFFVTPAVVKQRLRLATVSPEAARRLCRGRHDPRPADGVHGLDRSRAAGPGVGGGAALLHSRSRIPHPPDADRGRGARQRQARAVRRRRRLCRSGRRGAARPVSSPTMVAGCRILGLLEMLVAERLRDEAEIVRAEGWRWIEAAPEIALWAHVRDTLHLGRAARADRRRMDDARYAGSRARGDRGGLLRRGGPARRDRPACDRDRRSARGA